jgi:hypothetical protein
MTGEPSVICETMRAPPRSMPIGPWIVLVTLMMMDEVTV